MRPQTRCAFPGWLLLAGLALASPAAAQDARCDHSLGSYHALPGHVFTTAPPDCAYDDDIVLWESANLPTGMELDPVGGSVRWVPDGGQVGSYPGRVLVSTNVRGGSAVWTFDVTVDPTSAPSLAPAPATDPQLAVRAVARAGAVRFACESDAVRLASVTLRDVRGRIVQAAPPRLLSRGHSAWGWPVRAAAGVYWCEIVTAPDGPRARLRVLLP